jgi:hypothetical protein
MSLKTVALWSALGPFLLLPGGSSGPAPTEVRLTLATLHAAALTTPRATGDAEDDPYLFVSILGPGANTTTIQLPTTGHLSIHENEALGARPLVDLSLQPGDSVRLLVSVLEATRVQPSDEAQAATASTSVLAQSPAARASLLAPALVPVTSQGAHWLGSAVLLLTNEGGATYWRTLECVATCKVLKAPAGTALAPAAGAPIAGVVELSGDGGTYHLQVQGQRAS